MPSSKTAYLAFAFLLLLSSCKENPPESEGLIKQHENALAKFQDAQRNFKNLISTVRDKESFDRAKPGLDQVVTDWNEVKALLKALTPPGKEDQERFQKQISAGHKMTEPTSEDMISLILIEGREEEIETWLEEFARAGQDIGVEMLRLYGETDYSIKARKSLDSDLSGFDISLPKENDNEISGVPIFQWPDLEDSMPWIENTESEQPKKDVQRNP